MELTSSLQDQFASIPNSAKWTIAGGTPSIVGGRLLLDNRGGATHLMTTVAGYLFDSVSLGVELSNPDTGAYFSLGLQEYPDPLTGNSRSVDMLVVNGKLTVGWNNFPDGFIAENPPVTGGSGANGYYQVDYDAASMRYLRMTNSGTVKSYLISPDGKTWTTLFSFLHDAGTEPGYRIVIGSYNYMTYLDDFNSPGVDLGQLDCSFDDDPTPEDIVLGPGFTYNGGVATFTADNSYISTINAVTWDANAGVLWEVTVPDGAFPPPYFSLTVQNSNSSYGLEYHFNSAVFFDPATGEYTDAPGARFFRMYLSDTHALTRQWSTDGVSWTTLGTIVWAGNAAGPLDQWNMFVDIEGPQNWYQISGFYAVNKVLFPPYVVPVDPYNSGAKQPIVDSGTSTLFDLVKAFSVAVQRAVRITGPTTIEMINPNAPLPTGWTENDATAIYAATTRNATAQQAGLLSLRFADVALAGNATLVSNDVRLLRSGWRIPDRLPVYGLSPAAVQRVTYTFTPTGCTASVDYHFADVPLAARRQ
jgi:hypothetical protein